MRLTLDQRPRGWARFSPFQLRAAARRQAEEALDGPGGAARGPGLMRWWGWGEDGHAVALPPAAETLLREELGADPGPAGRPWPWRRCRSRTRGCPAAARERLVAAVGAEHVRDAREDRIGHAVGRSYPDLVRIRSGDASERARRRGAARVRRAGGGRAGRLRGAPGRGGPVRGRHERGGRRGAGAGRHGRRRVARPAQARLHRGGGPDLAHRAARRGPVRARGGAAARRRGRDARPLPAVVRVLDRGRLGGHALGGPGIHRLWADRRAGRGACAA